MTDHPPDHAQFEELAAGYALDALEPADEQRYLQHARQCPACTRTLADFREVAAALAETAPPPKPRPELGNRIMAGVLADLDLGHQPGPARAGAGDDGTGPRDNRAAGARPAGAGPAADAVRPADPGRPADSGPPAEFRPTANFALPPRRGADAAAGAGGDDPGAPGPGEAGAGPHEGGIRPADAVPLRPRSRRWLRPASAAAAAALIAAGGIWAGLAATGGSGSPPPAACQQVAGCTQLALTATGSHRTAAQLIVDHTTAWVSAVTIPANPPDEIYVLWQITGSKRPLPVGSFDVRAGAHGLIRVGPLAAAFPGTLAFAVSIEHGRTIPAKPSRVLALGSA